jgi:hypothetical protein
VAKPRGEEPLKPTKVQGRCAWCPCGERIELPAPTRDADVKTVVLRCPGCIKFIEIVDPWKPSGRRPRVEPEEPPAPDFEPPEEGE